MKHRLGISALVVVALFAVIAFGFTVERMGQNQTASTGTVTMQAPEESQAPSTAKAAMSAATPSDGAGVTNAPYATGAVRMGSGGAPASGSGSGKHASPMAKQMIVMTAAVSLRVKDVSATVEAVRKVAASAGAQVADLQYEAGGPETTGVQPEGDGPPASPASAVMGGSPPSAQITLRVPAAQLEQTERAVSALGEVTAQTSEASDVTAQHADMAARLRNLRAEESRLRTLFAHAGDVSDLLDVEQQLSSVRGDIESAQAQIAVIDNQVALSTLTVSLSQPGAIVRPASGVSWGISEAITRGIQSAVAVVQALIVGALTLAPLVALVLLAWGLVHAILRLRKRRGATPSATAKGAPTIAE